MAAPEHKFPIVGIGASAGGLEALEGFFKVMPTDTGMGFALVTHLARGQASSLVEILRRYTRMPVKTGVDRAVLNPNEVYVCPPDHIMTVTDGRLRLQLRADEAQRKPIDVFLSSLAEHYNEAAVGILLSGGGSDGTLGIKAIKEQGGQRSAARHLAGTRRRQDCQARPAWFWNRIDRARVEINAWCKRDVRLRARGIKGRDLDPLWLQIERRAAAG